MTKTMSDKIFLNPGDFVDIIAPSSKGNLAVLQKFKELLESWGLKGRSPDDLFGESLLYANSDEKRAEHLKYALTNESSKAIWPLLGGYGATKLMPVLAQIEQPKHSKILIGFSDITAIHIFLQCQWGWSSIHGPSGYQVALDRVPIDSINMVKSMLFAEEKAFSYDQIVSLNQLAENGESITAPIIGGNLHIIQTSLGTSWQINTDGKIVFIEEINERAYRVDRALAHLEQTGVFERSKAILFGDFIDKGEPDGKFLVQQTLQEFADRCALPVFQIRNVGHGPINNPIWLGRMATINTEKASLEFVS
jgi:muramoyltetrapeptide carboxypeptidase